MKEMKTKKYLKIFTTMFSLSVCTFGGGYVIISLMQSKFVEELQWLKEEEMLNLAAIAQSSPGAVAVNAAILVGYRIAGLIGAMVAILGIVIPPLMIISTISFFYTTFRTNTIVSAVLLGMQAGIAAVIFNVVLDLIGNILKDREYISVVLMIGAFIATYFLGIGVIYIIAICGAIGILTTWIRMRKGLAR